MFRTISFLIRGLLWMAFLPVICVYSAFIIRKEDTHAGVKFLYKSMGWVTNPFHR